MGKLIYIYGTMGSAKTANALMRFFELKNKNKYVVLMKPETDVRDGVEVIKSRIGLQETALVFKKDDTLRGMAKLRGLEVAIIDEAQFCTEAQINSLKELTTKTNVNIYCYGLKTDFTSHLFEGSKRLLEIADEIKELDMSCSCCGKRAEINARIDSDKHIIRTGDQIELGGDERYTPLCYKCWLTKKEVEVK